MKSIEFSNSPVLKVDNLDLHYPDRSLSVNSTKELFIRYAMSPWRFLRNNPRFFALRGITLSIRKKDRVGILGTNGSGKTTLCRAVSGRHGNFPEIKLKGLARAVFGTSIDLYPELAGIENAGILATLFYWQLPRAERAKIVAEAVEFSGLGKEIFKPMKTYSAGMKQRLFMSIASAYPTDLLILDEVFSSVDRFFDERLSNRLNEIMGSSGAVIFVSHSLEQIRQFCNRVIIMHQGRITFDGPVEEGIRSFASESRRAVC